MRRLTAFLRKSIMSRRQKTWKVMIVRVNVNRKMMMMMMMIMMMMTS